jgi:diguanylate cyclase (GGDEF)-like protein
VRTKQSLGLAMLDLDHFKDINDQYGHQVGDEVLSKVSHIIEQHVRAGEIIARVGGEEFCVIFTGIEDAEAIRALERFRVAVEKFQLFHGREVIKVTVSIGLCVVKPWLDNCSESTLYALADRAMYEAKKTGRNRICCAPD